MRPRLPILAVLLLLTGCQLTPRQQTQIAGDALATTAEVLIDARQRGVIDADDWRRVSPVIRAARAAWDEMDRTADDDGAAFAVSPWARAYERWAAEQAKLLNRRKALTTPPPTPPADDELPPRPGE